MLHFVQTLDQILAQKDVPDVPDPVPVQIQKDINVRNLIPNLLVLKRGKTPLKIS
jgi:hypothetical protein